jgi:hypothetical protein
MKHIFKIIALVVISLIVGLITVVSKAQAGGPWSDQYCDVEITKIKIVDAQGNVIEERTEEKLVCNDGAKDFLHGMGIADSCQMFTWMMPLQGTVIKQRDIACHKMNGEYEIVQGYHSID